MKIQIYRPVNKIAYALRTTAIVSCIGLIIGAGFVWLGAEKLYKFGDHWYGEFFREREMP